MSDSVTVRAMDVRSGDYVEDYVAGPDGGPEFVWSLVTEASHEHINGPRGYVVLSFDVGTMQCSPDSPILKRI